MIPEGFLKRSVGSPEQDRNPTAATSTTEPRNKRFIVNTSVRRSSKDASRIVRLKLLPYAGVVAPAQAEQIDPEELPGVVHGFAADHLAPGRNPGLAEVVRKDQLIGPKAGAIGKDVVGPLAAGVAPYLVRRGPALVLLPEHVVRGPAPGEDPAPIRAPPGDGFPAALLVLPVGLGDRFVERFPPLVPGGTGSRVPLLPEGREEPALGLQTQSRLPGGKLPRL